MPLKGNLVAVIQGSNYDYTVAPYNSAHYDPSGRGPRKERHAPDTLPGMSVFT